MIKNTGKIIPVLDNNNKEIDTFKKEDLNKKDTILIKNVINYYT